MIASGLMWPTNMMTQAICRLASDRWTMALDVISDSFEIEARRQKRFLECRSGFGRTRCLSEDTRSAAPWKFGPENGADSVPREPRCELFSYKGLRTNRAEP